MDLEHLESLLSNWILTIDETLFKRLSDADEISTLIQAIRASVDPLSHGQSNKQVAVIIKRVGKPGAALRIPA